MSLEPLVERNACFRRYENEHPKKEKQMRNQKLVLVVLALTLLTACETVKGVGRDVEATGAVITDSSRQVQNDM